MGYTTVDKVAGMFPTFARGTAQQRPGETLIQQYIDDIAGQLDAVLTRRGFVATGLDNLSIQALLSTGALNVLEQINRYGAAWQLGETLASFGVAAARDLAKTYSDQYGSMKNELDARDRAGKPLASGPYDKYFDPLARTETAEPALKAIAGGDQPRDQSAADEGLSNAFDRWGTKGT